MPGRNVFHESIQFSKTASAGPCVFVSHRKADKAEARELATALMEAGATIYFDEDDECLGNASEEADPARVVRCIDAGLKRCSHLLGLITPQTRGSWWVPYEIGATRAHGKGCAFLVHKTVDVVPAYVAVAEVLPDQAALKKWVPTLTKTASGSSVARLQALLENIIAFSEPLSFLPRQRDLTTIRFA